MTTRLTVLALSVALSTVAAAEPTPGYRVIVHADNPVSSVDRKFLADAFLKKTTRWAGDKVIKPVDASPKSPVRRQFSREVLSRSVAAVRSYWQRVVFSGRGVPPPELESDEAIVAYVRKHPGALGYVSLGADVNGTKVVQVK